MPGAQRKRFPACGTDDGVGGFNRIVAWDPSQGTVMEPVCFGACDACNDGGDGGTNTPYSLTIQVNMEGLSVPPEGVHIAGTWQGWDAGATPMAHISGTEVWTYTTTFPAGTYLRYKFINGNAWGVDESVARRVPTASTDSTPPPRRTRCLTPCALARVRHALGRSPTPRAPET